MSKVLSNKRYTIVQNANIPDLVETIIRQIASGTNAIYYSLRQAVENSVDAKSSSIRIAIDIEKKTITITDDGYGMRHKDREAFHRLSIPHKDGVKTIGKNNTGRISYLALCDEIRVVSKVYEGDEKELFEFLFNRQSIEEIIKSAGEEKEIDIFPIHSHRLEKLLYAETGTIISLEGLKMEKIFKIETIRQNLADYFSRDMARKIVLNGKPLPEVQQEGEHLKFSHNDSILGNIDVDLFIAASKKSQSVKIGAKNPIFKNLGEFLDNFVDERDLRLIPAKLFHEQLGGTILVSTFNKFREHSSRGMLHESFLGSPEQTAFIEFLITVLAPKVNAVFKDLKEAEMLVENEAFKAEIADKLNPVFGYSPKKHLPSAGSKSLPTSPDKKSASKKELSGIKVNRRDIELTPGEKQVFEVTQISGTSGEFNWDTSNAGGIVDGKGKKTMVAYTAGKEEGNFTLVVTDRKDASLHTNISISIVEAKKATISPKRVTIQQGMKQQFRLLHAPSSDVSWAIEGPAGKMPVLKEQTGTVTTVSVPKKAQVGQYSIVASVGSLTIKEEFSVEEPPSNDGYLLIEDTVYLLQAPLKGEHLPFMAQVIKNGGFSKGTKVPIMNVNASHPLLTSVRGKERISLLIPALISAHARHMINKGVWEEPELTPTLIEDLRLKILSALMKR